MKDTKQKKAFTLTELLVVVVIIGVLAAVVLPKFNKVMETRKTTEAEQLMAAVRTEQEYRCSLDKPYIGDINKLSQIIPAASTKHFTYSLDNTGMLASSNGKYSYSLKMPSYADGRICCDGDECSKLNKDYPSCDGFEVVPSNCSAGLTNPPSCTKTPYEEPCPAGQTGTISYGVDENCNYYEVNRTCTSACEGKLVNGKMVYDSYTETLPCDCNSTATATWTCNANTSYIWKRELDTSKCRSEQREADDCEEAFGNWDASTCTCRHKTCSWEVVDECYTNKPLGFYERDCIDTNETNFNGDPNFYKCNREREGAENYSRIVYWVDAGGCREDKCTQRCICK